MCRKAMEIRHRNHPANVGPEKYYSNLRDSLNRLFDENFWDPFDQLSSLRPWHSNFPKVDVSETKDKVEVKANVPGVSSENLDIEVDEESLSISGKTEKEEEKESKDEKFYTYEREYGEFKRDLMLPAKIDPEKVKADVKEGVLKITLPKAKEQKKKKVEVK